MSATQHAHNPTGWSAFSAELDAWAASGRLAKFWWRDDDATKPGPALDRLFAIAGDNPLALAVIPAAATADLAQAVDDHPGVTVLQHGFSHTNHAPAGEKKSEFGPNRPVAAMRAEIIEGRNRLAELFGSRFCPVFVPPWNRIADSIASELESCGFSRLSAFGLVDPNANPPCCNCHIDIINWHGGRGFLGTNVVLESLTAILADIRTGIAKSSEPVGLLTHHRDHDEAGWLFLEHLATVTCDHPGACWVSTTECLADH